MTRRLFVVVGRHFPARLAPGGLADHAALGIVVNRPADDEAHPALGFFKVLMARDDPPGGRLFRLLVGPVFVNLLTQHGSSVGVEFDAVGRRGPKEAPRLVTPLTVFRYLIAPGDFRLRRR